MISKTKLKFRIKRKTNPVLAETLILAMKHPKWGEVAKLLSGSTRKYASINLFEIDKKSEEGDTVVVVGKVLSKGELSKKLRICSVSVSERAKEKVKERKSEIVSLLDEIKKNPKAEGIKILK